MSWSTKKIRFSKNPLFQSKSRSFKKQFNKSTHLQGVVVEEAEEAVQLLAEEEDQEEEELGVRRRHPQERRAEKSRR